MLNNGEDTIIYTLTMGDIDYDLEIAYTMGEVLNGTDETSRGVEDWRVYKINGRPNLLGEFWAEQLDDERVCNAIMEWESE